ncbi:protease, partial [bacterium]|nr:protease [bacterium]
MQHLIPRSWKRAGLVVLWLIPSPVMANSKETLLLRTPTVSESHIAFAYAGDIWLTDAHGGEARRLTVNPGAETSPMFSPDGKWVAFTGNYDGNTDVFVVSVQGGSPKRLTFHPDFDIVRGWTPDSKSVLFLSRRYSNSGRYSRLYNVSKEGGFPDALPMPMADRGSFSGNGSRIAYTPIGEAFRTWKRYRGGRVSPIWLFDLKTYEVEEIAHENANTARPVWSGDQVYFLSDRNHTMNIFTYDTNTKQVQQVTHHDDFDVKSLAAKGDLLVYEQGGRIHLFSPTNGKSGPLKIHVSPDIPSARPHYEKGVDFIRNAEISPSGARAVFESRGEIFTVPAEKGDIRNITNTPGKHDRYPAWSPDGKWIAYFSDASGEYQLMLRDQRGLKEPRVISLGDSTFYYTPKWSPDSKKLVYTDKRLGVFYLDLKKKKPVLIDKDIYDHPQRSLDPTWSPDSKWIAYTRRLDNQLRAVFVYELATAKTHRITDGMSDAISTVFSKDGKYLYFAASTDYALNTGWLDLSSYRRPVSRSLYLVVLNKEDSSPFEPESDDEEIKDEESSSEEKKDDKKGEQKEADKKDKDVKVVIDFENIDQRILALPVPARSYSNLQAADEGKLFYLESVPNQRGSTLYRFDMKERKSEEFLIPVNDYWVSQDGKKLLYAGREDAYGIVEAGKKAKVGDGSLDLANMQVYVDPKAEWRQMFHELWRIHRDYFYVANMHGLNWEATRKQYEPFVEHVGHRSDLNFVFAEMMGEMVVGHNYVGGGDMPDTENVPVGLLGADYEI